MNDLTTREARDLNEINQDTSRMNFSEKIQKLIDSVTVVGTPVNAVSATMVLSVGGVVIHGESLVIDNPEFVLDDTYEFLATISQEPSDPNNIAVDIYSDTVNASGVLTIDTQPTSGDTMTIHGKVYTFVPIGTANSDGEISVGADLTEAQANIVAAINGTDGVNIPHDECATAAPFGANMCAIVAIVGGVLGNSIDTTETFTAVTNIFAAATLGSGVDCSAANAITALASAMLASDTQSVSGIDGVGDTVDLTSDIAGVIGNSINISENMSNAEFTAGATLLSGGVNGTVGLVETSLIDGSYLYHCISNNTISDANWRRISIGSVF